MCTDTPDSAKSFSGNYYSNTGMVETMRVIKGIHLVINVCPTRWTLQIWASIKNHLPLSCSTNKSLITQRNRARSLVTYIKQHLKNCLNQANKHHNEDVEKKILATIQCEKDISIWRRLKYSMGKSQGGSVRSVQIEHDLGDIDEGTTQ